MPTALIDYDRPTGLGLTDTATELSEKLGKHRSGSDDHVTKARADAIGCLIPDNRDEQRLEP